MPAIIRKNIKRDCDKKSSQVTITIKKENDVYIAIDQLGKPVTELSLSYNQLCSFSKVINSAIDNHYQEYSNTMEKEKTGKIYIDDPIDW